MPVATAAVTTVSTSSTASSTVGTESSAVSPFAAKVTAIGTGVPRASPLSLTDTFTVRASVVSALRVRVKTADSPSVTFPSEAIPTLGASSSRTVMTDREGSPMIQLADSGATGR